MQKRIPNYANGSCPLNRLIVLPNGTGRDKYGPWVHRLPRATLRRWRDLQRRGRERSGGRELAISPGWSTDRPVDIQIILKADMGIYAATPRTSSHGMVFEGQQTAAIDVGNWAWVYANCGGYNAWQEDVRAAGFTRLPDGYQQEGEYHHIIDWNPWDDEPEFGGAPAATDAKPLEEDDMYDEQAKKDAAERHEAIITALGKIHQAAAPLRQYQYGTGIVVHDPDSGGLWVLPSQGYGDLLNKMQLTAGEPIPVNGDQLAFATGFLSAALGKIDMPSAAQLGAADLAAIKDAISKAQVAVTSEQLQKLLDTVGAAARDGGEDGARKALADLTFVVTAS
ncbi:hypothetical protein QE418_000588 [Microbacterium testaceum]|uniref:hypothetical protein n=1 Tax=Microbacterium TaxID=33882 RepID=UPI002785F779|nr:MULTISPECIES: hypothetical protein [Microbacterium]MDQ1111140.1 hypothetical protein [Microbacterium testaceum]MDR6098321.1 hypothetical protein [Microbacterium sp. SORGH_AS_0454]